VDFGLSEEQELLKDTLRRFLTDRCPTTRVREVMESDRGHDEALWGGLAELGVFALAVPEAHGGLGRELLDVALVAEELGYAATPGPFLGHAMATAALIECSGEGPGAEAAARWLPLIASGEAIGSVAVGEDGGRWCAAELETRADAGSLQGGKPLVAYAGVADFIIVAARDDDGAGLWLVEGGAPGLSVAPLRGSDMTRRLDAIVLDGTPALRLGGEAALARTVDAGLILVAADAFGGGSRCVEMTRDYALEREQFGQPIGAFQAVKHQLADMAAELEPMLSFYWYAAHAFDHIRDEAPRHAAMAKAHLSDVFDSIVRHATELHGGIGFTWEFDLHLWFRRAIFDRSYLGDAAYHRARAADLAGW
jgi:alkylation response protein AidB-like acyl-CoA dehydrogenase